MDISSTTEPRSDQQNYDDYAAGEKVVTVTEVKKGTAEQPVELHLLEFPGRPFKPSKSMRRILVACWGSDSVAYTGRKLVLYGDPSVRFGGQAVGGIRIRAMSHLEKPVTVALTVSRSKREPFTVHPLTIKDESGRDWLKELAETDDDPDLIMTLGKAAKAAGASEQVLTVIRSAHAQAKEGGGDG